MTVTGVARGDKRRVPLCFKHF